jgi:hypothetical protein
MNAADVDYQMDDLLARWHNWRAGVQIAKGYKTTDSTCGNAQSEWSYRDRDNGVLDATLEEQTMQAVDRAMDAIKELPDRPWYTLLEFEARNMAAMAAVWRSPRLPHPNSLEYHVLRMEARNQLLLRLRFEGCIGT